MHWRWEERLDLLARPYQNATLPEGGAIQPFVMLFQSAYFHRFRDLSTKPSLTAAGDSGESNSE
jgi:hypothetical protein